MVTLRRLLVAVLVFIPLWPARGAAIWDVKSFGAKGDGRTLDSPAINRAIEAAAKAGGGTVVITAGTYVCGSLRLRSHLTLQLEPGAVIEASADPAAYDPPEPNPWGEVHAYQDFGHSHWRNSLLWGDGLENVAIVGSGRLYGKGLAHGDQPGDRSTWVGDKTIALRNCRNVTLRDFTIHHGGWFGVLATGVDHLTIDNVKVDTNRDGFDIDACQNVRITNCTVNSPNDDAICLKSSYALGSARPLQNVMIANCLVSGYDEGTLLDGTYQRKAPHLYRNSRGPHGRIKLGTESNGGFKNITITNCVFEYSRGLALETVDGALLEDVTLSNLTMRDIVNAPIFLRLGARMRGPAGTPVGACRRVRISNIVAHNVSAEHGILITGIPGHPVEDVVLSDLTLYYAGGGTAQQAARVVPEDEQEYPEPWRFGVLPSYGLFARHVRGLVVHHVAFHTLVPDARPAVRLDDVNDASFDHVVFPRGLKQAGVVMKNVEGITFRAVSGIPDERRTGAVSAETL